MKFVSKKVENIAGKGENAGYQQFQFLLFPLFPKGIFLEIVTTPDCMVKG